MRTRNLILALVIGHVFAVAPATAVIINGSFSDEQIDSIWVSIDTGQVSLVIQGINSGCVFKAASYDGTSAAGQTLHGVAIAAKVTNAFVDGTFELNRPPGEWVGACTLKTLTMK
jgi:hypothetical protein